MSRSTRHSAVAASSSWRTRCPGGGSGGWPRWCRRRRRTPARNRGRGATARSRVCSPGSGELRQPSSAPRERTSSGTRRPVRRSPASAIGVHVDHGAARVVASGIPGRSSGRTRCGPRARDQCSLGVDDRVAVAAAVGRRCRRRRRSRVVGAHAQHGAQPWLPRGRRLGSRGPGRADATASSRIVVWHAARRSRNRPTWSMSSWRIGTPSAASRRSPSAAPIAARARRRCRAPVGLLELVAVARIVEEVGEVREQVEAGSRSRRRCGVAGVARRAALSRRQAAARACCRRSWDRASRSGRSARCRPRAAGSGRSRSSARRSPAA